MITRDNIVLVLIRIFLVGGILVIIICVNVLLAIVLKTLWWLLSMILDDV